MIKIYTDGSSKGNPGPGGYAAIIIYNDNTFKEISQGFRSTTNNRMELLAIITALKYINKKKGFQDENIVIYSDSQYVINPIKKGWILKWEKNNFKNIKNVDLWTEIIFLCKNINFDILWIKGHSNNIYNDRCDFLAKNIIKKNNLDIDYGFENFF
ncbi:MAG: ribonuclease HI [Bacteroides sp.]|nr:MAG: ribonuclease HI [Bacteroides sp.]